MRQSSASDLFLNSSFPTIDAHEYQPFANGYIDVKMPSPNTDIRLFIFKPMDYPYLWVKYLSGLKREYTRMKVLHILDLETLANPMSSEMAMLAIMNGEIISGLRFHTGLKRAEDALVCHEMKGGNVSLLIKYLESWIPEKVIEPKGLWLNTVPNARKRVLNLMSRCGIYGAALMDCRYSVCTSPQNITRMHIKMGMRSVDEIGCVSYPTEDFNTTFGYTDLHDVLTLCDDNNRILLRRDWQQIHFSRLDNKTDLDTTWRPLVLDEGNPFHSQAIESLLLDDRYKKQATYEPMLTELDGLLPAVSDTLKQETKRIVVYPWKKRVIEILGPKSFKKLRTDRNRNKITDTEQNQLGQLSVGVVGLSTGHVIAHTLIMEGACGALKLADFDELEVSNLNRIPASLLDVGLNKAVLTARRIAELDPYLDIEVFDEGITPSNIEGFMAGLDVVIEECDSLDVKVLVRESAIKHRIPVLMATSDRGMMDVERFDVDIDPKPFHGLTDVSVEKLKDLSRRDKSGYALAIVDGENISSRLAASMVEIDHTVKTWSQLASDVTQGAAMAVAAVRRIGTQQPIPSSRVRMDIDECLANGKKPVAQPKRKELDYESPNPKFSGDLKEDILLAARFAPSPGNIQPWKFYWKKDSFKIEVLRQRTTSMDVNWRGAMVSLGAASFNAAVVAAQYDSSVNEALFPDVGNEDLVSSISLNKELDAVAGLKQLYPYLLSRVTNREQTSRQNIPLDVMTELAQVANDFPVKLHSLSTQKQLNDYADIAVESDRYRHLTSHLHKQMTSELVWPGVDSLDSGIDVRTLGLQDKDLNVLPVLARRDVMDELVSWDGGTALGDYNKVRIRNASSMVVITAKGNDDEGYFVGGKALQKFWLIAEKHGLVVQPVSPIFLYAHSNTEMEELMAGKYVEDVKELQQQFNELLKIDEGEYPVLVLRLAYAPKANYRSQRI